MGDHLKSRLLILDLTPEHFRLDVDELFLQCNEVAWEAFEID